MVVFSVSIMSILLFLLLSSSICRNVSFFLDLLLSDIILVTFACSVLLFLTRCVEIVSSFWFGAGVDVSIVFSIASRVRVFVFCLSFFCVLYMFGKSCVALISYETVKFRLRDDFGGRFLLRSYGVVSLVSIAA